MPDLFPKVPYERLVTATKMCGGLALMVLVALFISGTSSNSRLVAAVVCSSGTSCTTSSTNLSLSLAGTGLVNNGDGSVNAPSGQTFTLTWPAPTGGAQDTTSVTCFGDNSACMSGSNFFQSGLNDGSPNSTDNLSRATNVFNDGLNTYMVETFLNTSHVSVYKWIPGLNCFGNATTCGTTPLQQLTAQTPLINAVFTAGSDIYVFAVSSQVNFAGVNSYIYKWTPSRYAEGSGPISAGTGGAANTSVDRSWQVDNNNTVTKIGAYSSAAVTITVKLVLRTAANTYDVTYSQSCSHPGGGWYDCILTTPQAIPNTGTYYAAVYSASNLGMTNASVAKAAAAGDKIGTAQTITESSATTPAVRVTYQTAVSTDGCFGDGVQCYSTSEPTSEHIFQTIGTYASQSAGSYGAAVTYNGNTYFMFNNYDAAAPGNSTLNILKYMPPGTPSINSHGCFGNGTTCGSVYQQIGINAAIKPEPFVSGGIPYFVATSHGGSSYLFKWTASGTSCPTGGGFGNGTNACGTAYQTMRAQNSWNAAVVPVGSDLYLIPSNQGEATTPLYKWTASGTNCPGSGTLPGWGNGTACTTSAGGNAFQTIGIFISPTGSMGWTGFNNGNDTYIAEIYTGYIYKWSPTANSGQGCWGDGTNCANSTVGANSFALLGGTVAKYFASTPSVKVGGFSSSGNFYITTANAYSPFGGMVFKGLPGGTTPGCTLSQAPSGSSTFTPITSGDSNLSGVPVTPSADTNYQLSCVLTNGTTESTTILVKLQNLPTVTVSATDNAATEAAGNTGTFTITRTSVSAPPAAPVITSFTTNSSWTVPAGVTSVEVLVVGGGGGGGSRHGGGGGGGGVVTNATYATTPGAVMPITVGAGGQAGWYNGNVINYGCYGAGGPGGNSTFGTITAKGGGGGKTYDACTYVAGGSGGGGGGQGSSQSGGTATAGQGNVGGIGNPGNPAGGGGGGAGAVGGNYSGLNGGSGGNGIANSITGSSVIYGGGGGGNGADGGGIGGSGGTGGGGHGGNNGGNTNQTAGTNGLGGGGGGDRSLSGEAGAAGGSGIVIVKYTPGAGGAAVTTYLTSTNNVTTFATVGLNPFYEVFDSAGNLYVSNYGGTTISKITPAGVVSTFATVGLNPYFLIFDSAGNLYSSNSGDGTISKVTPGGVVSTFATVGVSPHGMVFDSAGNLYVAIFGDATNGGTTISKITPAGVVSTFATVGAKPRDLIFDSAGNLYSSNYSPGTISKITPAGVVSTFATVGANPHGMVFDSSGNLYVANSGGNTISKITPGGIVSTFATVGAGPNYLILDSAGNMYSSNSDAGTISKITPSGTVSTYATLGTGGPVSSGPIGLAYNSAGVLFVVNNGDNTVSSVGNGTWPVPSGVTSVEVLVVAGGGAGGASTGGGGGGGGVVTNAAYATTPGSAISITVGAGGVGVASQRGGNGGNSTFGTITAIGGGGGGSNFNVFSGANGGSGGGAVDTGTAGLGTAGQGNNGGVASNWSVNYGAGGGGGAGSTGSNGTSAAGGTGGTGISNSISGTATYYGGGGGGGTYAGGTAGAGGLGGGGNGGSTGSGAPTAGAANTGGGGGGQRDNTATAGASGGSGVIIIKYISPGGTPSYPPLDVSYTLGGIATNGTDYQTITSPLHFNDGEISKTITVTPTQDSVYEGPETVVLTIGASASYAVGSPSNATVTITDAQTPTSLPSATFDSCAVAGGTCELGISPPTRVRKGSAVTISWNVAGLVSGANGNSGDTCTITGSPSLTATGFPPPFAIDASNNWAGSVANIPVNQPTVVTLRCLAPDGTTAKSTSKIIQLLPGFQEL